MEDKMANRRREKMKGKRKRSKARKVKWTYRMAGMDPTRESQHFDITVARVHGGKGYRLWDKHVLTTIEIYDTVGDAKKVAQRLADAYNEKPVWMTGVCGTCRHYSYYPGTREIQPEECCARENEIPDNDYIGTEESPCPYWHGDPQFCDKHEKWYDGINTDYGCPVCTELHILEEEQEIVPMPKRTATRGLDPAIRVED